jgi:DNA-binding transcriptional LysR family regulator
MKSLALALPKVDCRLTEQPTMNLFRLLEDQSIDLAFLHAAFVPSIFTAREVDREQLQVVLPKTHRLAGRDGVRPGELKNDLNFVPEPQASQALHEAISNVFARNGGMPERTQTVEQVQTAIALVANGLGVVLAPESARRFLPSGTVMMPLEPRVTGITTLAVWRRDNHSLLLARVVKLLPKVPKQHQ